MHRDEFAPGPSGVGAGAAPGTATTTLLNSLAAATEAVAAASSLYGRMTSVTADQPCTSRQAEVDDIFGRPSSFSQRESVIKAAGKGRPVLN